MMFTWLSQTVAVTSLGIRTIHLRLASSLVAIVGIGAVAAVMVGVLSMAEGFRTTMAGTGEPDSVIVLRTGADAEMTSVLMGEQVDIIADAPGVARVNGVAVASAELMVQVDLLKRATGTTANVPLRGVTASAFVVRRRLRVIEGRPFQEGRNEVIVGRAALAQYANLSIGSTLKLGENTWQVVGIFDGGGTVADSEIWCDVRVLAPAYRRGNSRQSVYVRLETPQAFTRFKDALTSDPRLNVKAMFERDYYAEQSQLVSKLITAIGFVIAGLMGIGAVFAAVNSMYSAVASRSREIATLRALGFRGGAVVVSVLAEATMLALAGGAVGGAGAWLALNGHQTSTINWQSFSQVAFAFAVTPRLLVQGIVYAVVIGLAGGLLPAVRAARVPVVVALREL
ncbi:MAG: ABC transporter permease [Bacteroidales bacterium]